MRSGRKAQPSSVQTSGGVGDGIFAGGAEHPRKARKCLLTLIKTDQNGMPPKRRDRAPFSLFARRRENTTSGSVLPTLIPHGICTVS